MKRYLILSVICLLFFSGSTQDSIKVEAVKRTERQLDSMSKPLGPHRVVIDFTDIKSHMDSLNAQILRLIGESNIASQKRDSLTQVMLTLISENVALRDSNEQYRKDWEIVSKAPHIIFISVWIFICIFASQGISNYLRNRKSTHENK